MNVDTVRTWVELFLAFAAAFAIFWRLGVWSNRRLEQRIIDVVTEATRQIQPHTNGGKSLSDLHHKIDAFMEYQMAVNEKREKDISLLKTAVVDLENETEGIE